MEIHKYTVGFPGETLIQTPGEPRFLTVGSQGGQLRVWAEVDPEAPLVTTRMDALMDSQKVPQGAIYVGTVFDGRFVWHVYRGAV